MNVVEYSSRQSQWDYSTIFTEPAANSCFSIMAKVLLNSVVNTFLKLKIVNSVTIVWIVCIEISRHFLFIFIFEILCRKNIASIQNILFVDSTFTKFHNFPCNEIFHFDKTHY